jgi:glycosyltransferase involved in cell wall biosynthesis
MKFTILINTHNQKKYLNEAILSCIEQEFRDFETVICDTSNQKTKPKLKKLNSKQKINYFHYKSKYIQPEMNQMDKILFGLNKSKGDFICLMDGDDLFNKSKLSKLNNLVTKKKVFFNQDNPTLSTDNLVLKKKNYKDNYFFKIFINNWPQIYGTSSILVKRNILEKFFKEAKPFRWKYLAIDAQLAIFCNVKFKLNNYFKDITKKNIHNKNLGNNYSGLLTKKFWLRRYMQHQYVTFIKKEKNINLDFLITAIFYFFFKKL